MTRLLTAGLLAFLAAILSGHWGAVEDLTGQGAAVLGLIVGGVAAAPLAGYIVKLVPHRILMVMVGLLICALAGYQTLRLL